MRIAQLEQNTGRPIDRLAPPAEPCAIADRTVGEFAVPIRRGHG